MHVIILSYFLGFVNSNLDNLTKEVWQSRNKPWEWAGIGRIWEPWREMAGSCAWRREALRGPSPGLWWPARFAIAGNQWQNINPGSSGKSGRTG